MMAEASTTDDTGSPLDAALYYASLGWRVLPIKPGEKRPPMASWQHAATTDEKVIRNWYRGLYGGHGVGIATGAESGIFVLDVDVSDGKHGDDTLADLEATYGPLPDTVRAMTGTGGAHIFFAIPDGADIRNNAGTRLGPGLDIRGEGGQVVAAPTVHPNGRAYAWEDGYGPDEVAVADAPAWLIGMLISMPEQPERQPENIITGASPAADGDSIAEHINRSHSWHDLLYADGWQQGRSSRPNETSWTRPGKEVRDGASAVLHEPDGPLVVFSTDPGLAALHRNDARTHDGTGWAHSLFGYIAATRFGGDRSECARAYRLALTAQQAQMITAGRGQVAHAALTGEDEAVTGGAHGLELVDWPTFWATDHNETDWIAEPIIAAGRGHAIFAPGGTGKSLLSLWLAASIATGSRGLTGEKMPPTDVLYVDYEMTPGDLAERLDAMGYGPDSDLSHLHYAQFPSLPPLDTKEGGRALARAAFAVGARVVILDTFIRAVEGDENESSTTQLFEQYSGRPLKAAGIAWVRMDHSGKDLERGARGSSAKNDDVDVVWQMSVAEGGYALKVRKRRMGWVPENVAIIKRDDPYLTFGLSIEASVPAGTVAVIEQLDALGVDPQAGRRVAAEALRQAGHKVRNAVVTAAQKRRRDRPESGPRLRGPLVPSPSGTTAGTTGDRYHKTPGQSMGTTAGTTGDHAAQGAGTTGPPYRGDQGPPRSRDRLSGPVDNRELEEQMDELFGTKERQT